MNRALAVLSILAFSASLSLAGCGGNQDTSSKNSSKSAGEDSEEDEVSEKGKRWGGWRWKGKRNDCFFVYKNECFSKLEKACRKAKCGEDECKHNDSAPAKVSCKK